jgi:formiminoglutamase
VASHYAALAAEIARLRAIHGAIVLFEAHSIRSTVPRLFEGVLPQFNLGTNAGASCARALVDAVETACAASSFSQVTDGRFKGGYTTRHYGRPRVGVHAIQMELACRGYLREPPLPLTPENWPPPCDAVYAEALRATLARVLRACIDFTTALSGT